MIEALAFQKSFAIAVCEALEVRFADNHIMDAFKVLGPTNMPTRQVGLASWGVQEMETLCAHYGVQREFHGKTLSPLVNSAAIKQEFFAFKLQATTDWGDKSFKDVWAMVTWNDTLKRKYENLVILAEIARVQCVSTASCERAFSVQNCIKTKHRNRMLTKNLESVLRIAIEGPVQGCHDIFSEAIGIWKNTTKFRYLFTHPEKYLSSVRGAEIDECP